ncbi:MAG: hypothetical protein HQK83_13180 [Fibrobacteria bacterium]|nr:hypothetical protein [Fibrobacteria bacterium]
MEELPKTTKPIVKVLDSDNPEAIQLEYDVFLDSGYIKPNTDNVVSEYASFTHSWFVAIEQSGQLMGVSRIIPAACLKDGWRQLPTNIHFSLNKQIIAYFDSLENSHFFEVGTMAIRKSYRGGSVFRLLWKGVYHQAIQHNCHYGLSSIDADFYKILLQIGLPMESIGKPKYYMGSETVPVLIKIKEIVLPT